MNKLWVLVACVTFNAYAEEERSQDLKPVLTIKTGYQFADDDNYRYIDPRGAVFGVSAGLQFSPNWSADIGYQYQNDLYANKTGVNVKTWLAEVAVRYDYEVSNDTTLFTRFGVAHWDMDKSYRSEMFSATGLSPLGEVGIAYKLTRNVWLSTSYQYVYEIGNTHTGEYNSHMALLSASYVF